MKYKHLFFDLDHTLWDFETNARETLQHLHKVNDLHKWGVNDFDLFYKKYSMHNRELWMKYTRGLIKQEELRWKRMWLTLLDFKIADEALAKKLSLQFLEMLPLRKKLFPYTIEILEYLTKKNYSLHLITNGFDAIQYSKLANSNITKYFVEIITSEKACCLKPDKQIFEFAMFACNAEARDCIMIGDNIDADIMGAANAGIDTVFVNHLKEETHIKPTYTVHHLSDLEKIF